MIIWNAAGEGGHTITERHVKSLYYPQRWASEFFDSNIYSASLHFFFNIFKKTIWNYFTFNISAKQTRQDQEDQWKHFGDKVSNFSEKKNKSPNFFSVPPLRENATVTMVDFSWSSPPTPQNWPCWYTPQNTQPHNHVPSQPHQSESGWSQTATPVGCHHLHGNFPGVLPDIRRTACFQWGWTWLSGSTWSSGGWGLASCGGQGKPGRLES